MMGEANHINVKRRRITKPTAPNDDDDDSDAELRETDHIARKARHTEAMARRQKLEQKKMHEIDPVQISIVAELVRATHKVNALNMANCFDQRTLLDVIDKSCAERETMQDMAMAIESASKVYGYRVDKTHTDAHDTKYTFVKGKPAGDDKAAMVDAEGNEPEVPHKKKKNKADKEGITWETRYASLMENGEHRLDDGMEDEDAGEEDDSDDDEDDQMADDVNELLTIRDNIDERLMEIKEQRKKQALRVKTRNRMLEEDDDFLSMTKKELSGNDYYQKAVSRHGEGTAASMLLYNACYSGDGRVLYMHGRVKKEEYPPIADEELRNDFLDGVRATLCHALSQAPTAIEERMLPKKESLDKQFLNTGRLEPSQDEPTAEELAAAGGDTDATIIHGGNTALPTHELFDNTMMPDRTILETTMMPDETVLEVTIRPDVSVTANSTPKKDVMEKKMQYHMRGRDISDMYFPDKLHLASKPLDMIEFGRISRNIRIQEAEGLQQRKSGIHSEELAVPHEELRAETKFAEFAMLDDDVRDFDSIWNADIVLQTMTDDDCDKWLRRAEREGKTQDDVKVQKKRVLPPGTYTFFMENKDVTNHIVPSDPFAKAGDHGDMDLNTDSEYMLVGDDSERVADNGDAFDFGSADDDMMGSDWADDADPTPPSKTLPKLLNEDDRIIKDLLNVNGQDDDIAEQPAVNLTGLYDDIADVPVTDTVTLDPDIALRSMGKLDDSHWKANQTQPEKKERHKKDKPLKDEPKNEEFYFVTGDDSERAEARNRFKLAKPGTLERSEESLFSKKRATERRPHLSYNFNEFTKPGLLFGGNYGGVRFERNMHSHPDDAQFNQFTNAMASVSEEDAVADDVCREWLGTFGGIRIFADDDENSAETDRDSDSFHSTAASTVGDDLEDPATDDLFGGGDDHMDDDADTFHSADHDVTIVPGVHRQLTKHEQLMFEINDLKGDDNEDDDDGEMVTMMDRKVLIKNTNIDQSRVKSYLKQILTNPIMGVNSLKMVAETRKQNTSTSDDPANVSSSSSSSEKENHADDLNETDKHAENIEIEPLEVSRAVFAPSVDPSQTEMFSPNRRRKSSPHSQSQTSALTSGVILSDFEIEGHHSMTSLYACLPFRATRPAERTMHVAFSLSIALQMCNENTLHLEQPRPEHDDGSGRNQDWMGDFVIRNGSPRPSGSSSALSERDNIPLE